MNLEEYLKGNHVWHKFIEKPETIHTADAAKVAGLELNRLTKNLISRTDLGEYILLIIPGDKKVDLERVAKVLGVKKVRLVPFDQAEQISGYPPGATPSIGHKMNMKTVFDRSLMDFKTIYCGGGTREKLLELKTNEVIELSKALISDISMT